MKHFFQNIENMRKFAITAFIAGIVCGIGFYLISGVPDVQQPIYIIQGVLVLCVYRAYSVHEKNVMKGMLGALLMELILNELCYIFGFLRVKIAEEFAASIVLGVFFVLIEGIFFTLQVVLFINHFVINSDHRSSPSKVRLNQKILFGLMVTLIAQETFSVATLSSYTAVTVLQQIMWFVLEISTYGFIISVESKIDEYKAIRQQKNTP